MRIIRITIGFLSIKKKILIDLNIEVVPTVDTILFSF